MMLPPLHQRRAHALRRQALTMKGSGCRKSRACPAQPAAFRRIRVDVGKMRKAGRQCGLAMHRDRVARLAMRDRTAVRIAAVSTARRRTISCALMVCALRRYPARCSDSRRRGNLPRPASRPDNRIDWSQAGTPPRIGLVTGAVTVSPHWHRDRRATGALGAGMAGHKVILPKRMLIT